MHGSFYRGIYQSQLVDGLKLIGKFLEELPKIDKQLVKDEINKYGYNNVISIAGMNGTCIISKEKHSDKIFGYEFIFDFTAGDEGFKKKWPIINIIYYIQISIFLISVDDLLCAKCHLILLRIKIVLIISLIFIYFINLISFKVDLLDLNIIDFH